MPRPFITALAAALTAIGISASLGIGTFAYFSDTEASTGNLFEAGTLDLHLQNGGTAVEQESVVRSILGANMAPGDKTPVYDIRLINDGDLGGDEVTLQLCFQTLVVDDDDDSDHGGNSSGDQIDRWMQFQILTYDGVDLLDDRLDRDHGPDGDVDGDGIPHTLRDVRHYGTFTELVDPVNFHGVSLKVEFLPDAPNHLQGDAVHFAILFQLAQPDAPSLECTPDGVTDHDLDGVHDAVDNCVFTANPPAAPGEPQADANGDGYGDACQDLAVAS